MAIASVGLVALQLIDGTRWLVVFAPLLALLVFWLGQAVHAHRRAIALGATPGGEIQVAAFLPLTLTVLTLFWLLGGRHGSPAATVEAYMAAWMDNRPQDALTLFSAAHPIHDVTDQWQATMNLVRQNLDLARAQYGEQSGLDPARPFNSLRVTALDDQDGAAHFVVELVRSERFATTILGIVPTAAQRTVVVTPVLEIVLVEQRLGGSSGPSLLPTTSWRIDHFEAITVSLAGNIVSESAPTILTTPLSRFSVPQLP